MSYQHKSGAQKRKEKQIRENARESGRRTLERFSVSRQPSIDQLPISNNDEEEQHIKYPVQSASVKGSGSDSNSGSAKDSDSGSGNDGRNSSNSGSDDPIIDPEHNTYKSVLGYDVGLLQQNKNPSALEIEDAVRRGPQPLPVNFPPDPDGRPFPKYILNKKLQNSEIVTRDWLVWSVAKQALFCFPCRLFGHSKTKESSESSQQSVIATVGWEPSRGYKKLYDRIPVHESSNIHKTNYVEWRQLESILATNRTIGSLLAKQIQDEKQNWKDLLRRFLDVTLFLAERGLAFRGDSHEIGNPRNGNFLGTLELISHYDPLLAVHLEKVKRSQEKSHRLQVHYLSAEIQNEFISSCAEHVRDYILKERVAAKYFSIIVDATPDCSHDEQTTFILPYVGLSNETSDYKIYERFLEFANCNEKTGDAIAQLILNVLQKHSIPIADCRDQGYDNGSNMSGAYKGAQARILDVNPLAILSPCACHSLNLCGVHAAECCPEVITFFGAIQKLYNIFSASPQRWEILRNHIGVSLHSLSSTRWSARIESVKPFSERLPGIKDAIKAIEHLNLTPEIRSDLNGLYTFMESFECLVLASIWKKVLTAINFRSVLLQELNTTIDVEEKNLASLLDDLNLLRNSWDAILLECRLVAENIGVSTEFRSGVSRHERKRKKYFDESATEESFTKSTPAEIFKFKVFNGLLDNVIVGLTTRFKAVQEVNSLFCILWTFVDSSEGVIQEKSSILRNKYENDIGPQLREELMHLKAIYKTNFGSVQLGPLELLNKIRSLKLETLFPNVSVSLRLFCTIPVTIAQAERSFSCLARIKNVLRSTMNQDRVSDLGLLAIEVEVAKKCNFDQVIEIFASRKSRKAPIQ